MDCHFLLQGIFPTQESNPGLLHCRQTLYRLSTQLNGSLVYPLGDFTGVPKLFHSTTLVAQTVKRLPAMQETWVRFLGWEDPLEKEMAIHSSTLAWKIPWMEEPDRLLAKSRTRLRDFTFTFRENMVWKQVTIYLEKCNM